MNTAPLESSFRSQGTPRMGYINILMKTKRRKGFWHISTGCKECFHSLPHPEPHPPPPTVGTARGTPLGRWCKNHPLRFMAPGAGKKAQSPNTMVTGTKEGNSSCLEGQRGDSYRTNGVPSLRGPEMPSHEASVTFHILY